MPKFQQYVITNKQKTYLPFFFIFIEMLDTKFRETFLLIKKSFPNKIKNTPKENKCS